MSKIGGALQDAVCALGYYLEDKSDRMEWPNHCQECGKEIPSKYVAGWVLPMDETKPLRGPLCWKCSKKLQGRGK